MASVFGSHESLSSACRWLSGVGLFFAYAWIVHRSLVFENTICRHWYISFGMAAILLVATIFLSWFSFKQALSLFTNRVASFDSPVHQHDQVWFYKLGDDFRLYVRPENNERRFVMRLEEEGYYRFSYAEWTRDGEVLVGYFVLLDEVSGHADNTVIGGAYDFSANKVLLPSWINLDFDKMGKASNWEQFDSSIKPLIAAHGGLSGNRIDTDLIIKQKRWQWFWQLP